MPQPLYITSTLTDDSSNTYVLTTQTSASSGDAVFLQQISATENLNQLWIPTGEGCFISAGNPSLALAMDQNSQDVIVQTITKNANTQYWAFTFDGYLANYATSLSDGSEGSAQVLTVVSGAASNGATVGLADAENDNPPQSWRLMVSQVPTAQAVEFESGGENITAAGIGQASGPSININTPVTDGSQLWMLCQDGTIVSSRNPLLCLAANQTGPVFAMEYQASNQYPAYWTTDSNQGMIKNSSWGGAVTVASGEVTPGGALSVTPFNGAADQTWNLTPNYIVNQIVAAPPDNPPFPAWANSNQQAGYDYVNEQLSQLSTSAGVENFDLRTQYLNLTAPLSSYQSVLDKMSPLSTVPIADWQAVVNQLNKELTAAISVVNLFNNYTTLHDSIFEDEGFTLGTLISDAQIESGTEVSGTGTQFLIGMVNVALNLIPGIGGALDSLVQMGIALAASQQTISPDPFTVAVGDLYSELKTSFEALWQAIGIQEATILSDYNKMQTVYQQTLMPPPNTLAIDPRDGSPVMNAAASGYAISALQILLPAKYAIYRFQWQTDSNPLSWVPSYAQYVEEQPNGTWNKYWIADSSSDSLFPSETLMQGQLWSNGANQSDFFNARNGWSAMSVVNASLGTYFNAPLDYCDWAEITIVNATAGQFNVVLDVQEGVVPGNQTLNLPPYGRLTFGAQYQNGLRVSVGIYLPNNSNTTAGFVAHQHQSGVVAGDFWFDGLSWAVGYKIAGQMQFAGSIHTNRPGIGVITLSTSP